jgi:hypothetical protein
MAVHADAMTGTGVAMALGVAAVVAGFAVAQIRGLQQLVLEPDPRLGTRHRFELALELAAPCDALWRVVADLGAIQRYSTGLRESFVRGGAAPGIGAVRECADTSGRRWSERCTGWRAGRSLELEFQTKEAGFPYPLDPMHGGWNLDPLDPDRTRVTVWWSFTTKPAWAGWLLVPLMGAGIARSLPAMLHAMADEAAGRPRAS